MGARGFEVVGRVSPTDVRALSRRRALLGLDGDKLVQYFLPHLIVLGGASTRGGGVEQRYVNLGAWVEVTEGNRLAG